MTPEEAYEEALRRIQEAEKTGAVELNLSGVKEEETGTTEDIVKGTSPLSTAKQL